MGEIINYFPGIYLGEDEEVEASCPELWGDLQKN